MSKKRLLITGVSGLLGSNLAYYFRDKYEVLGIFNLHPYRPSRVRTERADLTRPEECRRIVRSFRPDICIHCAGMANIDRCEVEQQAAYTVNVEAMRFLVDGLAGTACKLVYISTSGGFTERTPVQPVNYYTQTKLEAEREAARCDEALIVRSIFFGWNHGQGNLSIAEWAVNELSAGRRIKGVQDVRVSGLYVFDLAELMERSLANGLAGIYNFASSDSVTKYELLMMIARIFGFKAALVSPTSINSMGLRGKRSKDLSLSPDKLCAAIGVSCPTVESGIKRFYQDRVPVNELRKMRSSKYVKKQKSVF